MLGKGTDINAELHQAAGLMQKADSTAAHAAVRELTGIGALNAQQKAIAAGILEHSFGLTAAKEMIEVSSCDDSTDARYFHIAGRVEAKLENRSHFIDYLRRAVSVRPDMVEAAITLSTLLYDAGKPADALEVIQNALARAGTSQKLIRASAELCARTGDSARAIQLYETLAKEAPEDPSLPLELCELYCSRFSDRRGIQIWLSMPRALRRSERPLLLMMRGLVRLGYARRALIIGDEIDRRFPNGQYRRLLTTQAQGRLRQTNDWTTAFHADDIMSYAFDGVDAKFGGHDLHLALHQEMLREAGKHEEDMDGRLFIPDIHNLDSTHLKRLKVTIWLGIREYIQRNWSRVSSMMPEGDITQSKLLMWANVVRSGHRHQTHIHEGSILSGVYFCDVGPPLSSAKGGELFFDADMDLNESREPAVFAEFPFTPGHGVIFPSWFPHGTRAFQGQHERISIAFDLRR